MAVHLGLQFKCSQDVSINFMLDFANQHAHYIGRNLVIVFLYWSIEKRDIWTVFKTL